MAAARRREQSSRAVHAPLATHASNIILIIIGGGAFFLIASLNFPNNQLSVVFPLIEKTQVLFSL
jgi:hypothetical protein